MSKITAALEAAVATVITNRPPEGERPSARQRAAVDRAFAQILKLIAPRIRHFIRQYGLVAHWDDAEQCCAIGVHRAIEAYDPEKAQFTTFVNWQIRGELQSLRFRLMTDQRPSAQKVQATTVSLNAVMIGGDGDENDFETLLVDEDALERTEAGASTYLARAATQVLIDEFVKKGRTAALDHLRRKQGKRAIAKAAKAMPHIKGELLGLDPEEVAQIEQKLLLERQLLEERVFGEVEESAGVTVNREQVRQLGKRAARAMADVAATSPRFHVMAEYGSTVTSNGRMRRIGAGGGSEVPGLAA